MVNPANTKVRVTSVKCPSCNGNGLFWDFEDIRCMWCKGTKRLGREDALHYADQLWMIAGGGYICGDHSLEDRRRMEAKANSIRKLLGALAQEKADE